MNTQEVLKLPVLAFSTSKFRFQPKRGPLRAYVAGALGFCQSTQFFYNNVVLKSLETMEVLYFDPFKPSAELTAALSLPVGEERTQKLLKCWRQMGANNADEIRKADVVIANLDGQELDGGTCSEIGFAFGIGKPILAWRGDMRKHGEEGMTVNLQVDHFVRNSPGGNIFSSFDDLLDELAVMVCRSRLCGMWNRAHRETSAAG